MKSFSLIIYMIFLTSCSTAVLTSKNPRLAAKNICMNSEGRGRLTINKSKYLFSYFSSLDSEHSKWTLGLSFPFQDEETFELDWSENGKMKFQTSLDNKILRENSQINPLELEQFITSLGSSLKDIIKLKANSKKLSHFWRVDKNNLVGQSFDKQGVMTFTNLNNKNFGLIQFEYKKESDQAFKIEFILQECFEAQDDKSRA